MCARDDKARWSIAVGTATPPRDQRDHEPERPKFPSVYVRDGKKCMRNNCRAKGKRLGKLGGEQFSSRSIAVRSRTNYRDIESARSYLSCSYLSLSLLPFSLTDAITTAGKLTWQRPDCALSLRSPRPWMNFQYIRRWRGIDFLFWPSAPRRE